MTTFRLKPAAKDLLLAMREATQVAPYLINDTSSEAVKELIKPDRMLIFFDPTTKKTDPATGKETVYAIPSPAGVAKIESYRVPNPDAKPRGPLPTPDMFVIEDNIPIPERTRSDAGRQVYPFDKLAVGQSFFIPPSPNAADPVKSKQSSVTAQNRKMKTAFDADKAAGKITDPAAVPVTFRIGPDTRVIDGNEVKGARVWRIT